MALGAQSGGSPQTSRPPAFRAEIGKDGPLPPIPQRGSATSPAPVTTAGREHAGRPQAGWQVQPRHPKAPPHWSTHCLGPLAHRLKESSWLGVLSAPVSEARDHYRGLQGATAPPAPLHYDTLMSLYKELDSDRWFVEPPVSTAHASYRRFRRSELSAPCRLDVPPVYSAHLRRSACVRAAPARPLAALPLAGGSSEYQSSFSQAPPHVATTAGPPVSQTLPPEQGSRGCGGPAQPPDVRLAVFAVPRMYATESDNYGSGKPRLV